MRRWLAALALALLGSAVMGARAPAIAQTAGTSDPQKPDTSAALRVYLDCQPYLCDFDYFRTALASVNWVRDRMEADVQILVSTQRTGSGGTEWTLTLIGRARADGLVDTLRYDALPNESNDITRKALVQRVRVGLVRYVARVSGPDAVTVSFGSERKGAGQTKPARDPWHYWVFQTQINGFMNGESLQGFRNIFGSVSADRVTQAWKTNLSFNESYNDSHFDVPDSAQPSGYDVITNLQRSYDIDFLEVRSVSPHWSVGATGSVGSSMYLNEHRSWSIAPAIEYDIFPYSESTRRQVRLMYSIGTSGYVYSDTTIYLKLRETIPFQRLTAAVGLTQPWGSVNVTGNANWFLMDPSKRSSGVYGSVNLRLIKGLALNVGGSVNSIRDQVYLPHEPGTDQSILLQERQRATSYRYFVNFGLSYSFGSIYNNVVNPRFGNGGMMIIF